MTAPAAMAGGAKAARYTRVAIALHWIIAALVLANLLLGYGQDGFGRDGREALMRLHMPIGLIVLGLTLLRLAWRLTHRPPPFDPPIRAWEATLAGLVHFAFYLALMTMPLSGWLLASEEGVPIFRLAELSLPVPPIEDIDDAAEDAHEALARIMIALIALHVGGALKHHLEGHRHVVGRMAPFLYRR